LTILIEILPFCNGLDKFTYLNSTFLVKVKLTSISYAACSNTCAYNNTMVESEEKDVLQQTRLHLQMTL